MAKHAKGVYKLKNCACTVTDTTFVKMCDKCQAEHDAIKERWQKDYEASKLIHIPK